MGTILDSGTHTMITLCALNRAVLVYTYLPHTSVPWCVHLKHLESGAGIKGIVSVVRHVTPNHYSCRIDGRCCINPFNPVSHNSWWSVQAEKTQCAIFCLLLWDPQWVFKPSALRPDHLNARPTLLKCWLKASFSPCVLSFPPSLSFSITHSHPCPFSSPFCSIPACFSTHLSSTPLPCSSFPAQPSPSPWPVCLLLILPPSPLLCVPLPLRWNYQLW